MAFQVRLQMTTAMTTAPTPLVSVSCTMATQFSWKLVKCAHFIISPVSSSSHSTAIGIATSSSFSYAELPLIVSTKVRQYQALSTLYVRWHLDPGKGISPGYRHICRSDLTSSLWHVCSRHA